MSTDSPPRFGRPLPVEAVMAPVAPVQNPLNRLRPQDAAAPATSLSLLTTTTTVAAESPPISAQASDLYEDDALHGIDDEGESSRSSSNSTSSLASHGTAQRKNTATSGGEADPDLDYQAVENASFAAAATAAAASRSGSTTPAASSAASPSAIRQRNEEDGGGSSADRKHNDDGSPRAPSDSPPPSSAASEDGGASSASPTSSVTTTAAPSPESSIRPLGGGASVLSADELRHLHGDDDGDGNKSGDAPAAVVHASDGDPMNSAPSAAALPPTPDRRRAFSTSDSVTTTQSVGSPPHTSDSSMPAAASTVSYTTISPNVSTRGSTFARHVDAAAAAAATSAAVAVPMNLLDEPLPALDNEDDDIVLPDSSSSSGDDEDENFSLGSTDDDQDAENAAGPARGKSGGSRKTSPSASVSSPPAASTSVAAAAAAESPPPRRGQPATMHFFVATVPPEDALRDASADADSLERAAAGVASPTTPAGGSAPAHHRKRSSGGASSAFFATAAPAAEASASASVFGVLDSPAKLAKLEEERNGPSVNNSKPTVVVGSSGRNLTPEQEAELLFGDASPSGAQKDSSKPAAEKQTAEQARRDEKKKEKRRAARKEKNPGAESSGLTTSSSSSSDDSLDDLVQQVRAAKPTPTTTAPSEAKHVAVVSSSSSVKQGATTASAAAKQASVAVVNPTTAALHLTMDIPRSPRGVAPLRPESISPPSSAVSGSLLPPHQQQSKQSGAAGAGLPCVFRLKRRVAVVGFNYMLQSQQQAQQQQQLADDVDDDDLLLGASVAASPQKSKTLDKGALRASASSGGAGQLSAVVRFPSLLQFAEDALPQNFFNPRIAAILADESLDDIGTPLAGPAPIDLNDDDDEDVSDENASGAAAAKANRRRTLEELHLEELSMEQQMADAQALLDEEEEAALAEAAAQLPSVSQRVQRLRDAVTECSEAWQEAAPVSPRSAPLMLKREAKHHSLRVESGHPVVHHGGSNANAHQRHNSSSNSGGLDTPPTGDSFGKRYNNNSSSSGMLAAAGHAASSDELVVVHESGSDDDDVNQVGPESVVWSPLYRRAISIGLPSRETSVVEVLRQNGCKTPRDLGRKLQLLLMQNYDGERGAFPWTDSGGGASPSKAKGATAAAAAAMQEVLLFQFVELAHAAVTVAKNAYLRHQPLFRTVNPPVSILGDVHGSFSDALYYVRSLLPFGGDVQLSPSGLVCLGDYVDRGPHSLEVFLLFLALFLQAPTRVVMLRGNHEDRAVCSDRNVYGQFSFLNQCIAALGEVAGKTIFRRVTRAFRHLPLGCEIVGGGGGSTATAAPGGNSNGSGEPAGSRSPSAQPPLPRSRGNSLTAPAPPYLMMATSSAQQQQQQQRSGPLLAAAIVAPKILCVHGGFPRFGLKQQYASTAALGDEKQRQSRTRAQARIEARRHFDRLRNPEFPRFVSLFPQGLPFVNRTLRAASAAALELRHQQRQQQQQQQQERENSDAPSSAHDAHEQQPSSSAAGAGAAVGVSTPRRGCGAVSSDGSYAYDFSSDSDEDLLNQLQCPAPDPKVQEDLLCAFDLLWSDPTLHDDAATSSGELGAPSMAGFGASVASGQNPLFKPNSRGDNVMSFTEAAAEIFMQATGYSSVIRGHQEKLHGYRVSQRGRVVTLFSSSNYCGHATSAGCMMVHADGGMQLVSRPYEPKPASPLFKNS